MNTAVKERNRKMIGLAQKSYLQKLMIEQIQLNVSTTKLLIVPNKKKLRN